MKECEIGGMRQA